MGLSAERVGSVMSYALSAFVTTLGCLSLSQLSMVIGIILGVLTYLLNRSHKRRTEAQLDRQNALFQQLVDKASAENLPGMIDAIRELPGMKKKGGA